MYNTHIQQLKEINLLLNKIKDIPHLFDNKHLMNPKSYEEFSQSYLFLPAFDLYIL